MEHLLIGPCSTIVSISLLIQVLDRSVPMGTRQTLPKKDKATILEKGDPTSALAIALATAFVRPKPQPCSFSTRN